MSEVDNGFLLLPEGHLAKGVRLWCGWKPWNFLINGSLFSNFMPRIMVRVPYDALGTRVRHLLVRIWEPQVTGMHAASYQ